MGGDNDTDVKSKDVGEKPKQDKAETDPRLSALDLWKSDSGKRNEPIQLAQAGGDRSSEKNAYKAPPGPVVLELPYGDPKFDALLSAKNYDTLRITGLPKGVKIEPGVDEKGGYYFRFKGGNDKDAPHYMPNTLKTVEVKIFVDKAQKQPKVYKREADELRTLANHSFFEEKRLEAIEKMPEGTNAEKDAKDDARQWAKNNPGFENRSTEGNTVNNLLQSLSRGAKLASSMDALDALEPILTEAINENPDNPYLRMDLADVYLGQALKPIIKDLPPLPELADIINPIRNGRLDINAIDKLGTILEDAFSKLNNKETMERLDAAIKESQNAALCARNTGGIRTTSVRKDYPLAPGYLYDNPDKYWMGAADQAYLNNAQLILIKKVIQSGLPQMFKLPPALPPKK